MSHNMYDEQWQDAIDKLHLLIDIETIEKTTDNDNENENENNDISDEQKKESANTKKVEQEAEAAAAAVLDLSPEEAFDRFALLYVRYLEILSDVEDCYDQVVHPQKRRDIKLMMDCIIIRVVQLKKTMIKHSPMPGMWPYLSLDKYTYMLHKNLTNKQFEPIVPKYFLEEQLVDEQKLELLEHLFAQMGDHHVQVPENMNINNADGAEQDQQPDDTPELYDKYLIMRDKPLQLSLSSAVQIIQKVERARQAMQRAKVLKKLANDRPLAELRDHKLRAMDENCAATMIQKRFKGHYVRQKLLIQNSNELAFLGLHNLFEHSRMRNQKDTNAQQQELEQSIFYKYRDLSLPTRANISLLEPSPHHPTLLKQSDMREKRVNLRIENEVEYERSIGDIRENLLLEEGPNIREHARQQRFDWSIKQRELTGSYPKNFDLFYKHRLAEQKGPPSAVDPGEDKEEKAKKGKGKKGKGKDKGKGKKGKKEDKAVKGKGKGKGKKAADEPKQEDDPFVHVQTPALVKTDLKSAMKKCSEWRNVDESENLAQKHSVEIVKKQLLPSVVKQIEGEVDVQLLEALDNLRMQLGIKSDKTKDKKKKKGKKGKKGKKKGGGKKKKKKKK